MGPPEDNQQPAASEPDYYALLGVEPTADAAAIDAAYQGRSLRFRVGQLRQRAEGLSGPSQEEIERAHAILSNPESRALYDAVYFPDKAPPAPPRRTIPPWVWAIAAVWVVAIILVACIGVRSRVTPEDGAIGRIVSQTATAEAARAGGTGTVLASPTAPAAPASATATQAVVAVVSPSATLVPTLPPTATPAPPTATATLAPTATPTLPPTATPLPPTATPLPPTPTPEPPTPTPVPPPPEPEPEPEPPTPSFQPTDRIGVQVNVNLRNGPGTGYVSLGPLVPGTLLQATGEAVNAGGQLWRRFRLADGRVGWVRDVDVFPVR